MERTVPRTGSDEVELYVRTYYSLLRATSEIQIRSLEEVHAAMGSALHPDARSPDPDMSAFIYSGLRLPPEIIDVDHVLLGQDQEVFRKAGIEDVESWQSVSARARRRRSFYDGDGRLACYIASRSDIDDLVPMLTAFQIEWNKFNRRMHGDQVRTFLEGPLDQEEALTVLANGIGVAPEDLFKLRDVWRERFPDLLRAAASRKKRMHLWLLAGSFTDYRRAVQRWWDQVTLAVPAIVNRPVYFVSSNTHSLVNMFTGFALRQEDELVRFLDQSEHESLHAEWTDIQTSQVPSSRENFLYYALKKYLSSPQGGELRAARSEEERQCGVVRVVSEHGFDVEVQVIELAGINPERVDPRLCLPGMEKLKKSDALVVNIDYPLGMAAYQILSHVSTTVGRVNGVYILGKAATLNGVIGDVMIPSTVHDEHSQNTYLFENCFDASAVGEDLVYGTVLDNQKAVSVPGTFLQTRQYMDVFYREGYTDIEMEAGPYLSAVYEMFRPRRRPYNEIVNLHGLPFDLGILHYASDTPLSKGRNLGAGSLSYLGMDPTYATSSAVLKRILRLEIERLG